MGHAGRSWTEVAGGAGTRARVVASGVRVVPLLIATLVLVAGCELFDGGGDPPDGSNDADAGVVDTMPRSSLDLPVGFTAEGADAAFVRFDDGSYHFACLVVQRDQRDISVPQTSSVMHAYSADGESCDTETVYSHTRGVDELIEPIRIRELDGRVAVLSERRLYVRGAEGFEGEDVPFPLDEMGTTPRLETIDWASDGSVLHGLFFAGGFTGPGRLVYMRREAGTWSWALFGYLNELPMTPEPDNGALVPDGDGGAHVVWLGVPDGAPGSLGAGGPIHHDTFHYVHVDASATPTIGETFDVREAYFRTTGRTPPAPVIAAPRLLVAEGRLEAFVPFADGLNRGVVMRTVLETDRWMAPHVVWTTHGNGRLDVLPAADGALLWQHPGYAGEEGPSSARRLRYEGGPQPTDPQDGTGAWLSEVTTSSRIVTAWDGGVAAMTATWNADVSSTLTFYERAFEDGEGVDGAFDALATSPYSIRVAFERPWSGDASALESTLTTDATVASVQLGGDGAYARVDLGAPLTAPVAFGVGDVTRTVEPWSGHRRLEHTHTVMPYRSMETVAFSDGRVAVLGLRGEVFVFERDWTTFTPLPATPEGYDPSAIEARVDASDHLWIRDLRGVRRWDGASWTVWDVRELGGVNQVTSFALAPDGQHWVNTLSPRGSARGVIARFDGTGTWTALPDAPGLPERPGAMMHGDDGVLRVTPLTFYPATAPDLFLFDGTSWSTRPMVDPSAEGAPVSEVTGMAMASDGTIYFAGLHRAGGGYSARVGFASPGGLMEPIETRFGFGSARLALHPDGRLFLVGGDDLNRSVAVYDGTALSPIEELEGARSIALDPEGHLFAAGTEMSGDSWVGVFDPG